MLNTLLDQFEKTKEKTDNAIKELQQLLTEYRQHIEYVVYLKQFWELKNQGLLQREQVLEEKEAIYERKLQQQALPQGQALKQEVSAPKFHSTIVSTNATLSCDNKKVTKTSGGNGWNCAVLGETPCKQYSVKLLNMCPNVMIGLADRNISVNGTNYKVNGFYLFTLSGNLYSQAGDSNKVYHAQRINDGSVVTVKHQNGVISFTVNGKECGKAFTAPDYLDLYPAFDIYTQGCEFEFLSNNC
ncbi:hypothetical protein C9374_004705 [Naegleria lovaniensis]|uniref:SPRY domain-containing protein n=1 Tax=Naegleria lovaniensis TaxID=51637 RepID=A0AA88GSI9_NAELO|nr:uncharacterized protein C9374_004705 [Naegleria lovaniensis]KAG2383368.1 hypothetical protein C9374_004705 [Naegleria lovaniensis]